jgi:glucosamine--fructose-6-phosphate aminotransferase (isomerizing)
MVKDTHLFREIHEQPQVLRRLLDKEVENIHRLAEDIHARQIQHVVIAARGTSDNAGRYAQYLFGAVNGLVVALATPSLFTIYKRPPSFGNSLVLGISQSGKSPDIVAVLAEARRQGVLTAALTNEPGSELASNADHVIDLHAGLERSVAATKTYTSELMAIAMLSASLLSIRSYASALWMPDASPAGDRSMMADLQKIPEVVSETLTMEASIAEIVPRYRYMRDCVVIGRGYNYSTAFEIALKLKELTYTIVEPYSSADFLHGPLAVIEHGFPAIVIAPSGDMSAEMGSFIRTLKQRQAEILVISDAAEILDQAHIRLQLPVPVPEWLSPLTAVLPGQIFAMHLAAIRNYDPDKPRALHKVTETH